MLISLEVLIRIVLATFHNFWIETAFRICVVFIT